MVVEERVTLIASFASLYLLELKKVKLLVESIGCCRLLYIFSIFYAKSFKKREKVTNLHQNLAKNVFFKFAPKRWTRVLFSTLTLKMTISSAGYVL